MKAEEGREDPQNVWDGLTPMIRCVLIFFCLYIGLNDVTEAMVTMRSPFCGYNLT